jgi:predicted DNA-binding protein (MmcQ/YjbR family)
MTVKSSPARNPRGLEGALRKMALALPETTEDFPWGHRAIKVRGKAFVFLVQERDALVLSVKLPRTGYQALALSYTAPTEYGLGKSGWITARIPRKATATGSYACQAREWIEESFAAVAPKKLAARRGEPT